MKKALKRFDNWVSSIMSNYKTHNLLLLILTGSSGTYFFGVTFLYLLLMVGIGLVLFLFIGLYTNSETILNFYKEIFKRFDQRELDYCSLIFKRLIFTFLAITSCILLLSKFISNDIISYITIVTYSFFSILLSIPFIMLLISVKSVFYVEKILPVDIFNNGNITSEIRLEEVSNDKDMKKRYLLEEVFIPDRVTKYISLFILIDYIYIKRNIEDKDIAGMLHDFITKLTGGNRETIRTKFSSAKKTTLPDKIEILCNSLKSRGKNQIKDIDKYRSIASSLLDEFNSTIYFKIPLERHEEFVLLCVLYFTTSVDRNEFPIIADHFDSITPKTLLQVIQKIEY